MALAPIFEDEDETDEMLDEDYDQDDNMLRRDQNQIDEGELKNYNLRHLMERFLTNVQTKDPILDQGILEEYVEEIDRNGFGWSGKSCLVVCY